MPKSPRFYSTPMDDGSESTPVQAYGLEERTPSIIEKPKLLRRMSHALDDIKEDFSLQIDPRSTADKLKRRSTLIFDGSAFNPNAGSRPETPVTAGGPPRSRPMSIMSFDAWSSPPRRLSRRLSHRLSIWSQRGKAPGSQAASISSPNLIGSSTQYATRSQASFI
ncbi:hypothetical protein NUU61_003406 [Penicillium alfredii]|uniref:Uncharacterized protein n=1 Tax=Penicillium alfredii TaxID=1506179 RepID=A0A9W9FTF5_9EURO|nr:uncharacterized protein NUU61_003406 [Penicillium alfredii]KAJ5106059.1 hypothetical protein NUU61_003406 [Penicillium alfredii]